eukprot:TRINITY_DN826_c0_g1_i1.p1 TRINITY_DN826_c0_g1~~TRINITY_DN826_c0_g1_i1.p1  ORF type:complete len:493 (-),score=26.58 TRINITY_DN826_c0_g1_i1:374-1852(-)
MAPKKKQRSGRPIRKLFGAEEESIHAEEESNDIPKNPELLPGLPDEVSLQCLARVPVTSWDHLKCVSVSWRDAVKIGDVARTRSLLGASNCIVALFFCVKLYKPPSTSPHRFKQAMKGRQKLFGFLNKSADAPSVTANTDSSDAPTIAAQSHSPAPTSADAPNSPHGNNKGGLRATGERWLCFVVDADNQDCFRAVHAPFLPICTHGQEPLLLLFQRGKILYTLLVPTVCALCDVNLWQYHVVDDKWSPLAGFKPGRLVPNAQPIEELFGSKLTLILKEYDANNNTILVARSFVIDDGDAGWRVAGSAAANQNVVSIGDVGSVDQRAALLLEPRVDIHAGMLFLERVQFERRSFGSEAGRRQMTLYDAYSKQAHFLFSEPRGDNFRILSLEYIGRRRMLGNLTDLPPPLPSSYPKRARGATTVGDIICMDLATRTRYFVLREHSLTLQEVTLTTDGATVTNAESNVKPEQGLLRVKTKLALPVSTASIGMVV